MRFLSSFIHCPKHAFTLVLFQISGAPPGAQACTFDIATFHRTCSVLPSHKPWLVVQGKSGLFYIDHSHPFGASSASSNAGMIANAAVDIWEAEGIHPISKYEDDLKIFRFPSPSGPFSDGDFHYDYDTAEALRRISPLGIPWHRDKCDDSFSFVTTFIGYLWDLPNKLVGLTEPKRDKFYRRVQQFLDRFKGHPCQLLDVQKIHGSLCHVAFVYVEGRSHLPSLSNFTAKFPHNNEFATRFPPHSIITDLKWWLNALAIPNVTRQLRPRGITQDLHIFVDASTSWGIGIVLGDEWAAFRLSTSWKLEGRDICWLETVAIELLVYFLEARNFHDIRLLIHSDNKGTIGALDKGRSRNHHINSSIRRTYAVLLPLFITPELEYVTSIANPADPISRGESGASGKQMFPSFQLPDELRPCFTYVWT